MLSQFKEVISTPNWLQKKKTKQKNKTENTAILVSPRNHAAQVSVSDDRPSSETRRSDISREAFRLPLEAPPLGCSPFLIWTWQRDCLLPRVGAALGNDVLR